MRPPRTIGQVEADHIRTVFSVLLRINSDQCMNNGNNRVLLIITLGLLSAFGPFVTDMYLPSLPEMQDNFATTTSLVQLGLTTSMLGLAVGQLVVGPLSDKFGRRLLLLISMWLFLLSTLAVIFAPNIYVFNAIRFIQGLAGAGGIVLSRSISADLYSGRELAKFLAIIAAVNGVAPVCAPIIGAAILNFTNWRGIFEALLGVGAVILLLSYLFHESLAKEKRNTGSIFKTYSNFGTVVRNKTCIFYILQQAFIMGILFSYISASPFILQTHYGLSSFLYGICFGFNAIGIGLGSALSTQFRTSKIAVRFGTLAALILSIVTMTAMMMNASVYIIEVCFFLLLTFLGITLPAAAAQALNAELKNKGTASALLGALAFAVGGIVSPLVGIGNIMITTGVIFLIFSLLSITSVIFAEKQQA